MTTETFLQNAAALLESWAGNVEKPEPERLDVYIESSDLTAAVAALSKAGWGYLSVITGVDLGLEDGHIEVLYHFCEGAAITTLRVLTKRDSPSVPSLCEIIPSASFLEREIHEMLGIECVGTPDDSKLYLPDDWPDGVYPLRKDFDMQQIFSQQNKEQANGND